jgi:HSP20 family molecular chaperone IbpA
MSRSSGKSGSHSSAADATEEAAPGASKADYLGTLWAPSRRDFDFFLGFLRASVAEPTWFAVPVDAMEDGESYTVIFDVATRDQGDLCVQGGDRSVSVLGAMRNGRRPERRICSFSQVIDARSVEVSRAGSMLLVHIRKKRPEDSPRDVGTR